MASYQRAYSDHPGEGQNPFSSANQLPQGQGQGGYAQGGYSSGGAGYRDEPNTGYGGGYGSYNNGGANSYPMSSNNPYASAGSQRGYNQPKKSKKKWIWIGVIIALIVIIGAVLGGVLGTQLNKNKGGNPANGSSPGNGNGNSVPSNIANTGVNTAVNTGANGQAYLAVATDTYMLPVYATGTNTAGYSQPTIISSPSAQDSWPADPSPPSNSTPRAHPRLIAPAYKWQALQNGLVNNDPYMKYWHGIILNNASSTLNDAPLPYTEDGGLEGSGVLDVAQHMKLKVKNWAYAYRMTNETKYADRVWLELTTAAGNNSDVPFGANDGTRWNPAHFLDVAQFCNVFAIGYDWLYDYWTDAQRDALMWSILNLGLSFGHLALTHDPSASAYSWWTGAPTNAEVNGNWNCVCNGGLSLAAMAIMDRDPTGLAQQVLALTVPNAFGNCFQGAHPDGTWAETANYWYFGTCAAGEFSSALTTTFGDDRGLAMSNPGWNLTSLYHIYVQGMTSLFNYGDVGPNKYATTANSLMYWSSVFNVPRYSLYQRDRYDASEPFSMFWYDPATSGTWWDNLPLDAHFSNPGDDWATGRSTWSDNAGTYWAMKSGSLEGHQTHGDLDLGDFVVDAIGQRWFGDLGSGQYLSPGYFSSEAQNSWRWLYYRKATMGQNTILVNGLNQNVGATPSTNFQSSGTAQGLAPSFNVSTSDTAFFTTDLTSAYNNTVQRGIRFLNGRQQILLQDDMNGFASGDQIQWRAHTNATVSINSNGATATLVLASQTMLVSLLNPPASATFSTQQATPLPGSPALPANQNSTYDYDMDNSGTTVLTVAMTSTGGNTSLQVLMNPQWPGVAASSYVTPPSVPVSSWSLTSHN